MSSVLMFIEYLNQRVSIKKNAILHFKATISDINT